MSVHPWILYVEVLTRKVIVSKGGAFGTAPLWKVSRESRPPAVRGYSEGKKMAILETPSRQTLDQQHLHLGLPRLPNWELRNECLLFTNHLVWSVLTARMDQDTAPSAGLLIAVSRLKMPRFRDVLLLTSGPTAKRWA